MKKLVFLMIAFLSLVAVSFTAGQVAAQTPTPGQRMQEKRQEVRENMCQRVKDRIEDRRERFKEHRDQRANIYRAVIQRLNNLVTKLEGRGCDAAQVKTDISTLESLVDELVAAFNLFIDKLQAVGVPVCQEEPGDWKAAMAQVREQLQAVKAKHQEIRSFYQDTLKPDVKAAGQACRATNE
jgi:cytochrome c556